MKDLSIIIVNYNVKEFLQNLLDSIEKATKNLDTEIIVVDNNSNDGSAEVIRSRYPHVNFIESKVNLGFGKANNLALEISTGKYINLINPDTIVREDTYHSLINFLENTPDAGMAGCKVLNPDGTFQLPCRRSFPGPWTSFTKVTGLSSLFPKSKLFAKYNLTYLDENETYEVDAISGAFMFFRREVFDKIGGFDPIFFMYGEDLDLCFRTQKAGFKVYYFHKTEIIHYKGESTKRSSMDETKVFYDAMHLFVKKHFSASAIISFVLRFAISLRQAVAFILLNRNLIVSVILDFIIITGSVYLAEHLYLSEHWRGFPEIVKPYIYLIPALLQIFLSVIIDVYKNHKLSVFRNIISVFFGFLLLSTLTYFLKQFAFSRLVVLLTYSIVFVFTTLWRIAGIFIFRIGVPEKLKYIKTLVVGSEEEGAKLADKIKNNLIYPNTIVGLIASDLSNINKEFSGFKVLGSTENIIKTIKNYEIENVIFISKDVSVEKILRIVSENTNKNVEFLVAGNAYNYLVGKSNITMLEDIPLLKLDYNISKPSNKFLKRLFDILISLLILFSIYPIILLKNKFFIKTEDKLSILKIPSVLKGKMSFVGPKNEKYFYGLYLGKPGITGLWKLETSNIYDEKELEKLDILYAKNSNIWYDIEIIGNSVIKTLTGK